MTTGYNEKRNVTVPVPLVLDKLRDHFRRTYLLNETQIETMMVSSSTSLKQTIASANAILKEMDQSSRFAIVFHSLKGLLLNMGEVDWAAYTKELEEKLKNGEQIDYAAAIGIIEEGLVEILFYTART